MILHQLHLSPDRIGLVDTAQISFSSFFSLAGLDPGGSEAGFHASSLLNRKSLMCCETLFDPGGRILAFL